MKKPSQKKPALKCLTALMMLSLLTTPAPAAPSTGDVEAFLPAWKESYTRKEVTHLVLRLWMIAEEEMAATALAAAREAAADEAARRALAVETNKRRHLIHRLDDERIEYDIILPEPPRRGEITLPLAFPRGLSFYQQGASGRPVRPEVQSSYAVYHHKRNNRYKTGKLCHIYRPRLFDTKGRWAWGELEQDGENLVILLPEKFMKTARYPVTGEPVKIFVAPEGT